MPTGIMLLKKLVLKGLRPQAPDAFGLNTPNQLVIGYHWLAFLNQARKNPQFTTIIEYKIDHISKTKYRTKKNLMNWKICFRTWRIFLDDKKMIF